MRTVALDEHASVTPIELFFDLVFVFTLTQVTTLMAADLTARGVIRGVEAEIFKGCETFKDGYLYANDSPGWGIEVDEKLAAKYPFRAGGGGGGANLNGGWGVIRRLDGTVIKQ